MAQLPVPLYRFLQIQETVPAALPFSLLHLDWVENRPAFRCAPGLNEGLPLPARDRDWRAGTAATDAPDLHPSAGYPYTKRKPPRCWGPVEERAAAAPGLLFSFPPGQVQWLRVTVLLWSWNWFNRESAKNAKRAFIISRKGAKTGKQHPPVAAREGCSSPAAAASTPS